MHDPAVTDVEAGHGLLAADEEFRRPLPVPSDRVDVDVAGVLDHEDDPAAVPRRVSDERLRRARPVELIGEHAKVAARRRNDRDPPVAREVENPLRVDDRELRAVGRPGHGLAGAFAPRELSRLFGAVGRDHVHIAHELRVPVVVPGRDERELRAVRRPRRRGVLEVAARHLSRLA